MMKSDVFKVSFHPFNLVNNLKCFQCFSAVDFTSQCSVSEGLHWKMASWFERHPALTLRS